MYGSLRIAAITVLVAGQLVLGETPLTASCEVVSMPDHVEPDTSSFVDIPGSVQILTVPSGTAYMRWSGTLSVPANEALVRPIIGDTVGESSTWMRSEAGGWAGSVSQSTGEVKLQIRRLDGAGINFQNDSLEWTLMVIPDAPGYAPAVSNSGLFAMMLVLLVGGTLLMWNRRADMGTS